MSKWIENYKKSNTKRVQQRIDKVKEELEYYKREVIDCPYDNYYKAIERREAELEELELLKSPRFAQQLKEEYEDDIKNLKKLLCKIYYIAENGLEESTQISEANRKKIAGMTYMYNEFFLDLDFKERVNTGLW